MRRHERLEPFTAEVLVRFTSTAEHAPAITINHFGKGLAVYPATQSKATSLGPVLDHLYAITGIQRGPQTSEGVFARVVDVRTLYVNTTEERKRVIVEVRKHGLVTNRDYNSAVVLGPSQSDLVQ